MNWIQEQLKGKKTYIVAAMTVGLGVAQAFGVPVPLLAWPILGALGMGSIRAGVDKVAEGVGEVR